MFQDFRTAWRSLRRTPAFTGTAIITLALAAGANAAIFAVVYGVLLKPLPLSDPDRLVAIWPDHFHSHEDLLDVRDRARSFSDVAAVAPGWTMSMTGSGEPTKITVARVSGNWFDLLGVRPLVGRTFSEQTARVGAPPVIVLGHAFWTRRFAADQEVIGRTVSIDGISSEIIGVMPPAFEVLGLKTDAYAPFPVDPSSWYHRLSFSLLVGRIAPGWTVGRANADYRALVQALRAERKLPQPSGHDAAIIDLKTAQVGDTSASLGVIAAAVALILVIGAANVGTLQLTRAAARWKDLAIRSALGASRARIVRQLLMESALVAVAGGLLGLAVAQLALPALLLLVPTDTPRLAEIRIDWIVAAVVVVGSTLLSLLVGVAPALIPTKSRTTPLLRAGGSSDAPASRRLRAAMVSGEIALALVLSIGAGLMLQSLSRLHNVDPGFRAGDVLTLHLQPSGAKYRNVSIAEYYGGILDRLRALPGVKAAGAIQHLPFSGYSWTTPVEIEGHPVAADATPPTVGLRIVTPGYFDAIGQALLVGRDIESADAARQNVAVVNTALARRFFGSPAAALGRTIRPRAGRGESPPLTIVGIVGDVHHTALTSATAPELYTSVAKNSINAMMVAIRTDGDPLGVAASVRQAVWSVDRDVPISDLQPMSRRIEASLGTPRLVFSLLGAFAVIGTALAALGVYGTVAYSVTRRMKEIGIMVALGAQRRTVIREVLREALTYAGIGLAAGVPCAIAGSRFIGSLVFGVSPTDAATYAIAAAATAAAVTSASALPALRAARIDPAAALR